MGNEIIRFLFIFLLTTHICFGQDKSESMNLKRGAILDFGLKSEGSEIRALIIGISNYQYVQKLKYANADAELFYNYLISQHHESIKTENIKLLIDEEASAATIESELKWLMNHSKEGDKVILYFAGHGGFEDISDYKFGYLLAYNSFDECYSGGGNISLEFLQAIMQSLSNKKVYTYFFIDACHAGKSLGGEKGYQYLNDKLSTNYGFIFKYLSSSGKEFSLEGNQWGGGHGVFTYYLIQGLMGLADYNRDSVINNNEIDIYLKSNVPVATNYKQYPKCVNDDPSFEIVNVNKSTFQTLQSIRESNSNRSINIASILAGHVNPSEARTMNRYKKDINYTKFIAAIKERRFLYPKKSSVNYYYHELLNIYRISQDSNLIMKEYLIAIQDYSQEMINRYMEGDSKMIPPSDTMIIASDCLDTLLKIIAVKNLEFEGINLLKSQKVFLNSYSVYQELCSMSDAELNSKSDYKKELMILNNIKQTILIDSTAAYLYNLAGLFGSIIYISQPDSSLVYYRKASRLAPNWSFPLNNIGYEYYLRKKYDEAKLYIDSSIKLNSNNPNPYNTLGSIQMGLNDTLNAIKSFSKSIELDSFRYMPYLNLANIYHDQLDTLNEKMFLSKSISLHSFDPNLKERMGDLVLISGEIDSAVGLYKLSLKLFVEYDDYESSDRITKKLKTIKKLKDSLSLNMRDYAIVAVKKGIIKYKESTSSQWKNCITGTKISLSSDIILEKDSYLGIVLPDGRPHQFTKKGKYHIKDIIRKPQMMNARFSQYVLDELKNAQGLFVEYGNTEMTGAVER